MKINLFQLLERPPGIPIDSELLMDNSNYYNIPNFRDTDNLVQWQHVLVSNFCFSLSFFIIILN